MKKPAGSVSHIATPLKAWLQRFAFIFLIVAAFALMLLGKADIYVVERVRTAVTDAVTPVLDLVSRPIGALGDIIQNAQELTDLRAQNTVLKRRNEQLRNWQAVARRLEAENIALRELNNAMPESGLRFVTARVIGDTGGAFARSVLVNAGARDGVRKGQAAITSAGLAGRVAEAGNRSARILLVTDINSRIPVLIGRARDRAILAGDNSSQPKLLYLAPGTETAPGDHVVTSGHGGVFPPGLPIGVVTQASETTMRVQPFVDWAHMEYLRLADYELPGTLLPAERAARQSVARPGAAK